MNDSYTNPNIRYLYSTFIGEYDLKDAGLSCCKEFKLLSEKEIERIENLPKEQKVVELGLLCRDNKKFNEVYNESFARARQLFFQANEIEDPDLISVKKDAIFTHKKCEKTKVGKYLNFRLKNDYTSYLFLPVNKKKFEFYYNDGVLDIKGLNDENYEKHKDYLIKYIKTVIERMETRDRLDVIDYMKRFFDRYKHRELDLGYYRTFDHRSVFLVNDESGTSTYDEYFDDEDSIQSVDIRFNLELILQLILINI